MKLSKAKELIENGTHFIQCDIINCNFKKELITLSNKSFDVKRRRKPIYLSEITDDEEIQWQVKDCKGNWRDTFGEYRIKQKPDFSKELEALNKKANENNMKVIVTFENNL